jgi:hypothetical protein
VIRRDDYPVPVPRGQTEAFLRERVTMHSARMLPRVRIAQSRFASRPQAEITVKTAEHPSQSRALAERRWPALANVKPTDGLLRPTGPYAEFLREAEALLKPIAQDTGARWPSSLPGLAKEIRRKPRGK